MNGYEHNIRVLHSKHTTRVTLFIRLVCFYYFIRKDRLMVWSCLYAHLSMWEKIIWKVEGSIPNSTLQWEQSNKV